MLVTNPWLAGPSPTKRLDRGRLEERILNLLSSQNMCVETITHGWDLAVALSVNATPGVVINIDAGSPSRLLYVGMVSA